MKITRLTLVLVLAFAVMLVTALAGGCAAPADNTGGTTQTPGTTGETTQGAGSQQQMNVTIMESNNTFQPDTVEVSPGATISFVNQDAVDHHIVVGTDDLGVQQPGQTVTWTANTQAVYPLKCIIHPAMTGQITVGAGVEGGTGGTDNTTLPGSY